MLKLIAACALALFTFTMAAEAKKCTDWCTNKSTGQKFRIRR
jgi:hypothetical protein